MTIWFPAGTAWKLFDVGTVCIEWAGCRLREIFLKMSFNCQLNRHLASTYTSAVNRSVDVDGIRQRSILPGNVTRIPSVCCAMEGRVRIAGILLVVASILSLKGTTCSGKKKLRVNKRPALADYLRIRDARGSNQQTAYKPQK